MGLFDQRRVIDVGKPTFDLQRFIAESHEKIIGHYRQLLATSKSDEERKRIKDLIETHEQSLQQNLHALRPARRAA